MARKVKRQSGRSKESSGEDVKAKHHQLTVRITDKTEERLRIFSAYSRQSYREIVEAALGAYLDKHDKYGK